MIYLMRHGLDNEEYVGGWSDVPLKEEGKKQVKDAAIWLKENLEIDNIYTSDIKRARETAAIVSSYLNIYPIFTQELREQNKGDLNGRLRKHLRPDERYLLENQQIDTIFPNGESLIDLYNRVKAYLEKIEKLQGNNLLITHRGFINMIYYIKENQPLDMDKQKYSVEHASVHVLNKKIRRIY